MNLPHESYGDIKEGLWIVHKDKDHIIRIWGSLKNGKERIYLDDALISEKRTFRKGFDHRFTASSNSNYYVRAKFNVTKKIKAEFYISKNEHPQKTYKVYFINPKFTKKAMASIAIFIASFAIATAFFLIFRFNTYLFILLCALSVIVFLRNQEKPSIDIVEVNHN